MSDPNRPEDLGTEIEQEVRMTLDEVATALQDAARSVGNTLRNDETLRRTVRDIGSAAREGIYALRDGVQEMQRAPKEQEEEGRRKRKKKRKKRADYFKKAREALSAVGWQSFTGVLMGVLAQSNFVDGGFEAGTLILGLLCASFLVSAVFSFFKWRKLRRIASYQSVLGDRSFCPVRELAEMSEKKESAVRSDLRRLILSGDYTDVYLSPDASHLFASETAYRLYMAHAAEAARAAAEPAPEPAPAAEEPGTLEQTRAFLRDIREAQRHISDAAVLSETHRIEAYTQSILAWLEKHPEDAGQIRRFVSYYMPTTLKLLTAWNEVTPQADSSSVAEEIQTDIRGILRTVATAFQNLQDNLLKDTALDISAEISALETVLAQDGLTRDSLFS